MHPRRSSAQKCNNCGGDHAKERCPRIRCFVCNCLGHIAALCHRSRHLPDLPVQEAKRRRVERMPEHDVSPLPQRPPSQIERRDSIEQRFHRSGATVYEDEYSRVSDISPSLRYQALQAPAAPAAHSRDTYVSLSQRYQPPKVPIPSPRARDSHASSSNQRQRPVSPAYAAHSASINRDRHASSSNQYQPPLPPAYRAHSAASINRENHASSSNQRQPPLPPAHNPHSASIRRSQGTTGRSCKILYVGNLDRSVTEEDLMTLFQPYGIVQARLQPKFDDMNQVDRLFGWLHFSSYTDARQALKEKVYMLFKGRALALRFNEVTQEEELRDLRQLIAERSKLMNEMKDKLNALEQEDGRDVEVGHLLNHIREAGHQAQEMGRRVRELTVCLEGNGTRATNPDPEPTRESSYASSHDDTISGASSLLDIPPPINPQRDGRHPIHPSGELQSVCLRPSATHANHELLTWAMSQVDCANLKAQLQSLASAAQTMMIRGLLPAILCRDVEKAAFAVLPKGRSHRNECHLFWRLFDRPSQAVLETFHPAGILDVLLQNFQVIFQPSHTAGVVESPPEAVNVAGHSQLLILLRGEMTLSVVERSNDSSRGDIALHEGDALWLPAQAHVGDYFTISARDACTLHFITRMEPRLLHHQAP